MAEDKKSCKQCWWEENGACYSEKCKRDKNGKSMTPANNVCNLFWDITLAEQEVMTKEKIILNSRTHSF